MRLRTPPLLGVGALTLGVLAPAGANPFQKNLDLLRARAEAARPATVRRSEPPARRAVARPRRQAAPPASSTEAGPARRFVSYSADRFGSRARGGDLVVTTPEVEGPTHVYVRQRLLSNDGNGQARVPDLAPGKHPVMVWAPDANKRRTYWVTIRSGRLAELKAEFE